jgi:opacity protein-like surface antigen
MFKRIAFLFVAICLTGSAAYAAAPDRVNHLDLGVLAGGAFNDTNVEDAGYVQANVSYGITPYIAIGAEAGWQEADGSFDEENVGSAQFMADIIVRNPYLHDALVPYGVVGLGSIHQYVTDEDGGGPNNNGDDVNDSSFGWKIGGGVDWFLNPNWALNLEIAYFGASNDLPGSSAPDGSDFVTVGGGIKFVF